MRDFVLSVLAVSVVVLTADAIKCYVCAGTEDVCAKERFEADKAKYLMTCPSSMDRCMKTWAKKDGITAVASSCATTAVCDAAKKACDNVKDGQCTVSCCETDECNANSAGSPTDGIKCFSCVGTEDECAKNELEADKAKYLTTCPSSMDRCMRTWAKKDDITALATSCATKAGCDAAKNVCDNFKDGQCTVSCCDTDECNGSPTDGIDCYVCAGTDDACARNRLEADKAKYLKTCSESKDRCMRIWAKQDSITAVASSCATKETCEAAIRVCQNVKDGQCDVDCCETDECNVDSSVAALPFSVFLMTFCFVVELALFKQ